MPSVCRCAIAAGVVALLFPLAARAATVADVDALVGKANAALKSGAGAESKKADTLRQAIEACQEALELLEEVPGLDEEYRSKRAADIMSIIYWCRKMMPLDIRGRARVSKGGASSGKATQGGEKQEAPPPPTKRGPAIDERAYKRAKTYASKSSDDLQGILRRYEGVAASFPKSKWGKLAAKDAESIRAKLVKQREIAARNLERKVQQLDFVGARAEIKKQLASAPPPAMRSSLSQLKADIAQLQKLWLRLVATLGPLRTTLAVSFEDVGLEKKAWVRGGKITGALVSEGTQFATPTPVPWKEFGARAMVRLATHVLAMQDGANLEKIGVAATVAGDYVCAHDTFDRLLTTDPERAVAVADYFARAEDGYKASSEGSATIRFDRAKTLMRARQVKEAVQLLVGLQQDLAKNSANIEFLQEVDDYRRKIMREEGVNENGDKLSAFERKVRAAFGGDAKLDEQTGHLEVFYDFSRASQLRDWMVANLFNQPSMRGQWGVSNGRAVCRGGMRFLQWKFPITEFDISADIVYQDRTNKHRVIIQSCMNKDNVNGVWASYQAGRAMLGSGSLRAWGWYGYPAGIVWRPGEVATVRFSHTSGDAYPFQMTINGTYAVSGQPFSFYYRRNRPENRGAIAFNFDQGAGWIDNVSITGTIDLQWFAEVTKNIH